MNERILIEGLRSRNKEVFDYTFNYYYSGLCTFSMRYIKSKEAVKDLVQDFFVQLWVEAPNLQIKTSLKSYLFTSLRNRCLDEIKHHKVIEKYQKTFFISATEPANQTEMMITETELRLAIQNCMNKLSPRCKEIFELSRIKGKSNQEIADKLKLSKRTVELQISRAIKILRIELADFLPSIIIAWLLG